MEKREDFRQQLSRKLSEQIEHDRQLPWGREWQSSNERPFNPVNGVTFKGGNLIALILRQNERGSDDPRWMTFQQANAAGFSVRKGAKATHVEYYDWSQSDNPNPALREPRVFYPAMFNGSDIVGLPAFQHAHMDARDPESTRIEHARVRVKELVDSLGILVEHSETSRAPNGSVYLANVDALELPPIATFTDDDDYLATVLKGIGEWAAHPSRLNLKDSDSELGAAKGLLRAELVGLLLSSALGVRGRAAAYSDSWTALLSGDKHELFRCANDAEKTVAYLVAQSPQLQHSAAALQQLNSLQPGSPPVGLVLHGAIQLPNFIPAEAVQLGRKDPRWDSFVETLRASAQRTQIDNSVVVNALNLIEPQFVALMDSAHDNGYTADDMNELLTKSIVAEMATADVRQNQWDRFCVQARAVGAGEFNPEAIEHGLQSLGVEYAQLIERSTSESWPPDVTEKAIRTVIFGDAGRRPLTPEYVRELISRFPIEPAAELAVDGAQISEEQQKTANIVMPNLLDQNDVIELLQATNRAAINGYSALESWDNLHDTAERKGVSAHLVWSDDRSEFAIHDIRVEYFIWKNNECEKLPVVTELSSGDGKAVTLLHGTRVPGTGMTAEETWQQDALKYALDCCLSDCTVLVTPEAAPTDEFVLEPLGLNCIAGLASESNDDDFLLEPLGLGEFMDADAPSSGMP